MKDICVKIARNEQIAEGVWKLCFPAGWERYDPGQFAMILIPGGEVFLRRPFGIVGIHEGMAEVCYKVVGKGTAALSRARPGEDISVLGPLGRGFRIPQETETAVLVAGGYGIAPLVGVAHQIRKAGREAIVYYGGRIAPHLLYLDELKGIGAGLRLTTEDGSAGERGTVLERLKREVAGILSPSLLSCGPHGMIADVAKFSMEQGIKAQVSLETSMACGLGVCLGCVCKDSSGNFVRVCREGPVFDAEALRWGPE